MSATISVEEALAKLKELLRQLAPGETIIITENQQPLATLIAEQAKPAAQTRPGPGLC